LRGGELAAVLVQPRNVNALAIGKRAEINEALLGPGRGRQQSDGNRERFRKKCGDNAGLTKGGLEWHGGIFTNKVAKDKPRKSVPSFNLASAVASGSIICSMATKQIIKPAKSPAAVGPYNHAVRVGDLLFCAGQIPIDPQDGNLISGDIKAQTDRVLQNVKAILDDQKLTFANVVKSTVFLTNLGDFAGMNEIYAKYFTDNFPARSTIQVAALPKGANVEIEVVAHF
jgi:2-iminobutanoate/2-iminopropanoate deaminase